MYDVAIIGAGPGGYVAAIRAGQLGAKTVLIEKSLLGGTCLNYGCIPSKTMLASAEAWLMMRRLQKFGIYLDGKARFDWQVIVERKNRVVRTLRNGIQALLKKNNVEIKKGTARLLNPTKILITPEEGEPEEVQAKKIIIATGSRPAQIPAFNIDRKQILVSDDAFDLQELPESMIIVGAGVIGCEFATLFSAFGVKITIIELLSRVLQLTPIPATITQKITNIFSRRGVKVITGTKISSLSVENSKVVADITNGEKFTAECAIVSTGRELNTQGIGLEDIPLGLTPQGAVSVNENMQTTHPDIYAIGDITGKQQLAHLASRQGILAIEHCLKGTGLEPIRYETVPACVFTEPPVGFVGPSEADLQKQQIDYKLVEFPYRALGVAYARDELEGSVWLIAEKKSERILGGGVFGLGAPELIHTIAMGVANSLTVKEMNRVVFTHPTFAEAIGESLESLHFAPIHK